MAKNKTFLCLIVIFLCADIFAQAYGPRLSFIKSLKVETDSTWNIRIQNDIILPKSMVLISGKDTVQFSFEGKYTEESNSRINTTFFNVDYSSGEVTVTFKDYGEPDIIEEFAKQEIEFTLKPEADSLEMIIYSEGDTDSEYKEVLAYGGDAFFPALGPGRSFNQYFFCHNRYYYYHDEVEGLSYPYILKGRVYDVNGGLFSDGSIHLVDPSKMDCLDHGAAISADGSYELRVPYEMETISKLQVYSPEKKIGLVWFSIEPISLEEYPFGSVIETDIHLLSSLSVRPHAEQYIHMQKNKLLIGEGVLRCTVSDVLGRAVLHSDEKEISMSGFSKGFYIISLELDDGRMCAVKINN